VALCLSLILSSSELSLNWMPSLAGDIISIWALRLAESHVVEATPVG
jgi:hypothetical protein